MKNIRLVQAAIDNFFCFNLWFQSKCRLPQCQKSGFQGQIKIVMGVFISGSHDANAVFLRAAPTGNATWKMLVGGNTNRCLILILLLRRPRWLASQINLKGNTCLLAKIQNRRNSTPVKCDSRINLVFELAKRVHFTEMLNQSFNQCSDFSPVLEELMISAEYISVDCTILLNLTDFKIEYATFFALKFFEIKNTILLCILLICELFCTSLILRGGLCLFSCVWTRTTTKIRRSCIQHIGWTSRILTMHKCKKKIHWVPSTTVYIQHMLEGRL